MTEKFCLACDDGTKMRHEVKDLIVTRGSHTAVAKAVSGWHCPVCHDCQFDDGQATKYSQAVEALEKLRVQDAAEALRVNRKKLKLRQIDASAICGGGDSAFSEYENGKTQPPKSTYVLMSILAGHPDLVEEAKQLAISL